MSAQALLLSVVIHTAILALLLRAPSAPHFQAPVYEVSFLAPEVLETKAPQIVTPSEAPEVAPAPSTPLRSDRDQATAREQIKRGDEATPPDVSSRAAPSSSKPASPPAPPQRESTTQPSSTGRAEAIRRSPTDLALRLDGATVLSRVIEDANVPTRTTEDTGSEYRPFSRPFGSGARFLGNGGSLDFLPHLPDGDITLLNAKADRYAVFVRRVAARVFSELRAQGWEQLRMNEVNNIQQFVTVTARISVDGAFVSAQVDGSSGSRQFDELLLRAVERGAADGNPPMEASNDGKTIEFIFQSRSWARPAMNPRTGAPTERRWLLLGTGLR